MVFWESGPSREQPTVGLKNLGINWIAITRADAKVLPVSSKTRNDNAKLPTIPPIHPKVVAAINREKFSGP